MAENLDASETENQQLVNEFEDLHNVLRDLVDKIPQRDRERVIFDQWSLKDVLAHIEAWNKIDALGFNTALNGKNHIDTFVPDNEMDDFNARAVEAARRLSWDEIYQKFVSSGFNLAEAARKLPASQWDSFTIDSRFEVSLRKDFGWSISHYRDEHIPQLQAFVNQQSK